MEQPCEPIRFRNLISWQFCNLILWTLKWFMRTYTPEDKPRLGDSSSRTNHFTHYSWHPPYFRENDWLQYTLRFSWLHLLSSPPPVGQGWLLLPGEVQPPSDGHQSLQRTVVCYHPTVNVCQYCRKGQVYCFLSDVSQHISKMKNEHKH